MKIKAIYNKQDAVVNVPLRQVPRFDPLLCDLLTRNGLETIAETANAYEENVQVFMHIKGMKPYLCDQLHRYLVAMSYVEEVKPVESTESEKSKRKPTVKPAKKADVKQSQVTNTVKSASNPAKVDKK